MTLTGTRSIYQQDLEAIAGIYERILCAPAALLTEALTKGYSIDPRDFVSHLEWSAYSRGQGWSRPALSRFIRDQYGVANVSWWIGATGQSFTEIDLERMRAAGYIRTPQELAFLQTVVPALPKSPEGIFALVQQGYHVVVTVKPGFGANTTNHALILTEYDAAHGIVRVFNPDLRDQQVTYSFAEFTQGLAPLGACTIVL